MCLQSARKRAGGRGRAACPRLEVLHENVNMFLVSVDSMHYEKCIRRRVLDLRCQARDAA